MKLNIIATNTYATASKAVLQMLKKTDQTDLQTNHVVISNNRCVMSSELEMLDALGGSFNTHVLTFARLTSRLMKEKEFISKQSAIMLIGRLAQELSPQFLCFTKSYDTAGFAAHVYETISQFKYSAISPEQINPGEFEKNLQLKMHDIKLIYQAYEDFIKDRYIDSGAKLNHLIECIPASDFIKNSYFYIKDFDDFSAQEELIIRQLVIYSKGVVVALPYVKDKRIYPTENFDHLLDIAKGLKIEPQITYLCDNQSNYVFHLENNLFDYKTQFEQKETKEVFVSKESDVFAEAELVAKHICQKTREGARYKDFLVVAGDVKQYTYALERVFSKYQIAYFLDNKTLLGEHALAQFIVGVINAFKGGFRRDDCLAVMKNYFYVSAHDINLFENVCLKNNLRFFGKPFEKPAGAFGLDKKIMGELDFAEKVRGEFADFMAGFGFCHSDLVSNYVQKIKDFVQSDGIKNMAEQLCRQADGIDDSLAKISAQAIEKTVAVLNTLNALFGDVVAHDQKFCDLLQTGLNSESISIIPLYNDCVVVTSVAKARANANKHLVVMGANDGNFPVVKKDTRIVSDGDIDALVKNGIDLRPKTESENFKEKFNVFQLLCYPRQSLFITYLARGDKSAPCLAVEEIEKMFKPDESYVAGLKKTEHVFGEKQAKEKLVCEMSKMADGNLCGAHEAESLFFALDDKKATEYIACDFSKPNLQKGKNLLLPKEKTSVTKIECFYSCPYKYFLQNGLKLKTRDTGELKSIDTGVILHDVLENFVKELYVEKTKKQDENFSVNTFANSLADKVLQRDEYQYLLNHPKLAHTVTRIKQEAVSACSAIYLQMQNSAFKPFKAELGFGLPDSDLPPVKIVADGHEILLTGKIDRVDVCGDKFVIVDYKTGKASFDDNELFAGKKLQLLTYVRACLQFLEKQCAGFFYMPVNDTFSKGEAKRFGYIGRVENDPQILTQLDSTISPGETSRLFGSKITKKEGTLSSKIGMKPGQLKIYLDYTEQMLQNAIKEMAQGFISQHPYDGACGYCDYAPACNFKDLGGQEDQANGINLEILAKVTGNEI